MNHSSPRDQRIGFAHFIARRLPGVVAICALCIGLAPLAVAAQTSTDDSALTTMATSGGATGDPFGIDEPAGTPPTAAYSYDTAFALHGWGIDRFSDSPDKNFFGRKVARLDNGDVVVAGLVPRSGSSTSDQVGLVRYTTSGRRVSWSSIDPAFARYNNEYIVFPNGASGQPTGMFVSIGGIQEHDGNLYVMANEQASDGGVHPIMLVFGQSGVFRGWWTYFPGGGNQKPGTAFAISGTKLIVLGADPTPDGSARPQIWMSRYTIAANGGLSFDSDFGSGGFASYRAVACTVAATSTTCSTYPADIDVAPGPVVLASPKFYVAATVMGTGHLEYGTIALRFNGNGTRDTGFGYDNAHGYDTAEIGFHDGGDNADIAVAIRTTSHFVVPANFVDDIYVVSKVSRDAQTGIGVFRLDEDGNGVTGFGSGGKILFGGCGDGAGNCEFSNVEEVPLAMTLSQGRVAIAGWFRGFDGTTPRFAYPMFAVVNAASGTVENFSQYTIGIGDAVFYDVVADGDGSFSLAGDGRELAMGNNVAYLVAHLQPNDFIFHNAFE